MENANPRAVVDFGLQYVATDWPHGLMCAECPHVFREGERFTTSLYAFSDDVPMCLVLCLRCATGGRPTRDNESALPEPPA
jgi:hypothetical protein